MPSSHKAVFRYDRSDAAWLVEFPSLPGCHTYGRSLDEARANAREALQVWLDDDEVVIDEDVEPGAVTAI